MTSFISPVKEVDSIWIEKMPSRPVKVIKAVHIKNLVLAVAENGRLYSNHADPFTYTPGDYPRHERMFNALRAIGALTKEQIAAHKAACDRVDKLRAKRYAADALVRAVKDGAPPLTVKQRAFVEEHGTKKGGA